MGRPKRLKPWNYGLPGPYFITFNVQDGNETLSELDHRDGVKCNPAGDIVSSNWFELPERFPGLVLDEMVVMPDHVHGILFLGTVTNAALINQGPTTFQGPTINEFPLMASPGPTLGHIIRSWKAASCKAIRTAVDSSFKWQPGYHDRILRNEEDLRRARAYICGNPVERARTSGTFLKY